MFEFANARINVFLDGEVWCAATWVDGEFSSSDPIEIDGIDEYSEGDVIAAVMESWVSRASIVQVHRVDDVAAGQ